VARRLDELNAGFDGQLAPAIGDGTPGELVRGA
jgi:hypothetical protein